MQLKGDLEGTIQDYQEALRLNPDQGTVNLRLADILRKLGRQTEADEQEKLAQELMAKVEEYNQACFEAIRGNMDRALELLKIGLEKGQATKEWARKDLDFENIRDDSRFKELVGE